MTMIAFTLNYNVPFIVGDLLFTSEDIKEGIELPTKAFDIKKPFNDANALPVSLLQKIYILKPNLCVALAGDSLAMQNFLEELKMRCKYYGDWEINRDIIVTFLNDLNLKNTFKKSAFCFMLLQGERNSFQDIEIGHPPKSWKIMENDLFEKVYVCGTGDEPYLQRMQIESKHKSNHQKGDFLFAIQNNINLFARILAEEKTTGQTTQKQWGAGFETIYFDGNSFTKFDDITYVVLEGEYISNTGDIGKLYPTLIMHYKYYDDTLLITSIAISVSRTEIIGDNSYFFSEKIEVAHFKVGTLFKDYTKSKHIPENKSFSNERISAGFAIKTNNGIHTPAFYTEKDGAMIEYSEEENRVILIIKSAMINEVRNGSKEAYPHLKYI